MSRNSLKVAVLGLVIFAVVLVFGSKDGTRAAEAQDSIRTIYPAGGSDGPPSP